MGLCPFVEECPKRVDKAFFIEVCVKAGRPEANDILRLL